MDPIIIIRDDEDLFDVQVNQVKLFTNFSLEKAIIAYWCMLFVGQFHFPKGGDGICYLIQRYFMDHKEYEGELFLFLSMLMIWTHFVISKIIIIWQSLNIWIQLFICHIIWYLAKIVFPAQ